ncbi:MAG: MFS transporter, partial [Chloroflexi bacterium]
MSNPATQAGIGSTARPPIELPHPVRMRVLGAVMVGVFLGALDQTVVGTALPRIITDLGGNNLYTWAFTAYLLTATISGPLYGKLSDLFGRRPVFLFGIGVFMLGSLLSGLTTAMWQFVVARGVQGLFLGALDQTVVGTALPRIITDLGGNNLYTWAFTAYLLTATISGPLYGKLSDLFGRRPVFLFGIGVFMLGSLLSGLTTAMWQFVVARGVQGLGAGALFPIAMATIADLFAPHERGRYQGLFGAVFALSSLLGPAIGGLITDTIGWHFVFFVNLPVGAVVLLTVRRYLPQYHPAGVRPRIDYIGAALFAAALVPILVGLTNKQSAEWTDPSVGGLIALGVVVLAIFVGVEARAAEPIVPLGLFRTRAFTVSVASVFLAASGFFTAVVFLPRWFQVVGGASATISGYEMLPLLSGIIISAVAAGQTIARTGRYRRLTFGSMLVTAAGLALLTQLRADTPQPLLWAWMFVTGIGVGPIFAAFPLIVQSNVPVTEIGAASSSVT